MPASAISIGSPASLCLTLLPNLPEAVAKRRIDEQFAVVLGQARLRSQVAKVKKPATQPQALHRHAVLRQRSGLVAADRRRRTQRLDSRQVAHQRIALGHPLCRHGQRQRDRRQQTFRNVGDDDADGKQQVCPGRQAHGLSDEEQRDAHARRERRDDAGQARNLPLQRRGILAHRLRQMGDPAELGPHAGGVHHGTRLTPHHRRAGQHDVLCIQGRVLGAGFGVARLGQGFAGDRRGVHAQPEGFDQAAIGRQRDRLPRAARCRPAPDRLRATGRSRRSAAPEHSAAATGAARPLPVRPCIPARRKKCR